MLILMIFALIDFAAEEGFERYQIIIDKHPFGEEPPSIETLPVPSNQSFARHLRLSMLFEGSDNDLRAGFVDSSQKENYILRIGEVEDGLELVSINLLSAEAMLREGSEVVLFKLESAQSSSSVESSTSSRHSSYAERRRALLKKINPQFMIAMFPYVLSVATQLI